MSCVTIRGVSLQTSRCRRSRDRETQGALTGSLFDSRSIVMTAKANHTTPATRCPAPVVLFGIDGHGKPKGARFGKDHADLAIKAASQLQLRVLASNDPKIADLATRLPVGGVHPTGRTFVPFIRRDLYDKLVAAAPNGNTQPTSPPASESSGAEGAKPPGGSSPNLPKTWQEISLGDLVVAQEA